MKKTFLLILTAVFCWTAYPANDQLYVFCGAGDNHWNPAVEPVDSKATINAMLEWMSKSYGISRLYWRAVTPHLEGMRRDSHEPYVAFFDRWYLPLNRVIDYDRIAVEAARRHNMDIFYYTGLLEFGSTPDTYSGYQFESKLRIAYPQYVGTDRFGERSEPGPISFAYPEARKLVIDSFISDLNRWGYDGVNFYTYVENFGIRYEHEFGFEEPVIKLFNEKYPDVDLKTADLTPEQAEHWYYCRGVFITQFLRELKAELKKSGKKLSMILDAPEPQYVQPWWGRPIRGTGKIHLDYKLWIKEGLVDELWVQLADTKDQQKLLDELLVLCKGTNIKLTVRAVNPMDKSWDPYRAAGVTPIAVITWTRNGIERYTPKKVTINDLNNSDWIFRAQTLRDIGAGIIPAALDQVTKLASDPNVLVRRNLCTALGKIGETDPAAIIELEKLLFDRESAVSIQAATMLIKVNRPETADALLKAAEGNLNFQCQNAYADAIGRTGIYGEKQMLTDLHHPDTGRRLLAIRGLRKQLTLKKSQNVDGIFDAIEAIAEKQPDITCRRFAFDAIVGIRTLLSPEKCRKLNDYLIRCINNDSDLEIQSQACYFMRYMPPFLDAESQKKSLAALSVLFEKFGDNATRPDAAYGWRHCGNAIYAFDGGKEILEKYRTNGKDKFLAYNAYRVVYERQVYTTENGGFNLIDEKTALENHKKYAPPFPGRRGW